MLTYLSLGGGVQSSALYVLALQGRVPLPDCAIFADTQAEPGWVYQQIESLRQLGGSKVPIRVVSAGNLEAECLRRDAKFMKLPAFSRSGGMLRRQCTREYKIVPIEAELRGLLGLRPRQRPRTVLAVAMIGISLEEAHRMKPSLTAWIRKSWPLVDLRLRRADCRRIVIEAGLPEPRRSACVFCPFHSDREWLEIKRQPIEWARALAVDEAIRDSTRAGINEKAYLHDSREPLKDATFDESRQVDLWGNECEGMCGH